MRLIDADALIDKYGDWYTEEGTEEGYIGTIKGIVDSMPTIEPDYKWIPCSERLPERRKHYIVTDFGDVEEACYTCDGHWFSVDGNKLKDVTAWMPLPEPWRGR